MATATEDIITEYGRRRLSPKEAAEALKRMRWQDYLAVVMYMIVILYFMRGLGIVITPELIAQIIERIAVLPTYLRAVMPQIYTFYTFYMLISATAIMVFGRIRTFLPHWIYPLDSVIHIFCGLMCFFYTGDIGYLVIFAGFFGFLQLFLYWTQYVYVKSKFIETALRGSEMGVRPRLSYEEAVELGLPDELIEKLGIRRQRPRGERT